MNTRGFSLIEVIIVMAIITVLLGLSTQGLILFKSSIEVKESGRQLLGTIDLIKNAARNDVRKDIGSNSINFKGFSYSFTTKQVNFCQDIYAGQTITKEWECSFDEDIDKTFQNLTFPLILEAGSDLNNPNSIPQCDSIYIESLTGDILTSITPGLIQTTQKCVVYITDTGKNRTNYLVVNGLTDTYQILSNIEEIN